MYTYRLITHIYNNINIYIYIYITMNMHRHAMGNENEGTQFTNILANLAKLILAQ